MTPGMPINQPSLDTSIADAHRTLGRIEYCLESLLADLNGSDAIPGVACDPPSCGLVADADRLSNRLDNLSGLADRIKSRVISQNVVEMQRAGMALGSAQNNRI